MGSQFTDPKLQAEKPANRDKWHNEGGRGEGKLVLRVSPDGTKRPTPLPTTRAKNVKVKSFSGRDLRRTGETHLAELGITKDIRAQLLSHGISGVQAKHYVATRI